MTDQKNTSEVKLLRVLSLRDLVIYGIIRFMVRKKTREDYLKTFDSVSY